jgi:hypothetical protein
MAKATVAKKSFVFGILQTGEKRRFVKSLKYCNKGPGMQKDIFFE